MYTREPDAEYDGRSKLGIWWIGAEGGFLRLDLAADQYGWIHAIADGVVVISVPRPCLGMPVAVSNAWRAAGHEVIVYAQTLDDGDYVSCDVFVDGYSLSTSEPASVISQRFGEVANAQPSDGWRWYG